MLRQNVRLALATLLTGLILGCSSAPNRVTKQVPTKVQQESPVQVDEGAEYYLNEAQKAYTRTGDIRLRNLWLLRSAQAFKDQQQCQQTQKIVQLLKPELVDNEQFTQANVLLAECLITNEKTDPETLRTLVDDMSYQVGFDGRIERLRSALYVHQQQWLKAAKAILQSDLDASLSTPEVWGYLQNLTQEELEKARLREPVLQPWIQLSLITQRYGLDPLALNVAIEEWQSRFAGHPLSTMLPAELIEARNLVPKTANKIAVLLPLSGRLASQGQAIKQGVLAAYFDANKTTDIESSTQITFFDSNLHSPTELAELTTEFDTLIGPLLKDKLISLQELIPEEKTLLALNRIDESDVDLVAKNRYYFALAPEDEAQQLAHKVREYGAQNPVIIASENGATKRMAEAFMAHWSSTSADGDKLPSLATFTNNKSLRTSITTALDVEQSKGRIKQVERLLNKELHSVPRNRRDVDAIVIFANAEQTELLNPIIESSLSPFSDKTVPVFASHRSYSLNLSNNSLRDLRNLTFTDMPWMLPEHPWAQLAQESEALWPQRSDALRRLFALGFDAYTLLPSLQQLRTLGQVSTLGLTGKLSVADNGHVLRVLPYGRVDNDKVTLIAMDR